MRTFLTLACMTTLYGWSTPQVNAQAPSQPTEKTVESSPPATIPAAPIPQTGTSIIELPDPPTSKTEEIIVVPGAPTEPCNDCPKGAAESLVEQIGLYKNGFVIFQPKDPKTMPY